jgi:hypothetical protein
MLNLPERLKNKGNCGTDESARDTPRHGKTSLDVLHLLAHLLNSHLHIHRAARSLEILGLR